MQWRNQRPCLLKFWPMPEWLSFTCLLSTITLVAIVLLAWRDTRHRRLVESSRTIDERIAAIHENALFDIRVLQKLLDDRGGEHPELMNWIPPVLDHHRRLASLAADPASSPEEAEALADEAAWLVDEQQLTNLFVGRGAKQLADLLRERNGTA